MIWQSLRRTAQTNRCSFAQKPNAHNGRWSGGNLRDANRLAGSLNGGIRPRSRLVCAPLQANLMSRGSADRKNQAQRHVAFAVGNFELALSCEFIWSLEHKPNLRVFPSSEWQARDEEETFCMFHWICTRHGPVRGDTGAVPTVGEADPRATWIIMILSESSPKPTLLPHDTPQASSRASSSRARDPRQLNNL